MYKKNDLYKGVVSSNTTFCCESDIEKHIVAAQNADPEFGSGEVVVGVHKRRVVGVTDPEAVKVLAKKYGASCTTLTLTGVKGKPRSLVTVRVPSLEGIANYKGRVYVPCKSHNTICMIAKSFKTCAIVPTMSATLPVNNRRIGTLFRPTCGTCAVEVNSSNIGCALRAISNVATLYGKPQSVVLGVKLKRGELRIGPTGTMSNVQRCADKIGLVVNMKSLIMTARSDIIQVSVAPRQGKELMYDGCNLYVVTGTEDGSGTKLHKLLELPSRRSDKKAVGELFMRYDVEQPQVMFETIPEREPGRVVRQDTLYPVAGLYAEAAKMDEKPHVRPKVEAWSEKKQAKHKTGRRKSMRKQPSFTAATAEFKTKMKAIVAEAKAKAEQDRAMQVIYELATYDGQPIYMND